MDIDNFLAALTSSFALGLFWLHVGRLMRPGQSIRTRYPDWLRALCDIPETSALLRGRNLTDREFASAVPAMDVLKMLITAKVRPTERDFYKRFYAALNAFILSAGFYALSPYLIYGSWDYGSVGATAASALMFAAAAWLCRVAAELRLKRIREFIAREEATKE